ncbi:hypothetical protein RSOL_539470, partial [Rhizoctonia solani AG-3 Rhs1AP]
MAPSGEPHIRSRSASITSTASENHLTTPKPAKSGKNDPKTAHTAGGSTTASWSSSRASQAPSMGGSGRKGGAIGASEFGETSGDDEEEDENDRGNTTYTEANTGITGISSQAATSSTGFRSSSEILGSFSLQTPAEIRLSVPLLATAASIAPAPVARVMEQEQGDPSPGVEAKIRSSRRQGQSWVRGIGEGPSLSLGTQGEPAVINPTQAGVGT